jgi:hypothetical protein
MKSRQSLEGGTYNDGSGRQHPILEHSQLDYRDNHGCSDVYGVGFGAEENATESQRTSGVLTSLNPDTEGTREHGQDHQQRIDS